MVLLAAFMAIAGTDFYSIEVGETDFVDVVDENFTQQER
jgi:hypothetical protein